jgi:translation initiation factor 2B subunit (eIF-2B alpha/beta/delta family)
LSHSSYSGTVAKTLLSNEASILSLKIYISESSTAKEGIVLANRLASEPTINNQITIFPDCACLALLTDFQKKGNNNVCSMRGGHNF